MYSTILALHIIVVIILIGIILIQRGRSSGLIEALGGVESIFGTKTSSFLIKLTVTLVVLFFFTSITLAYLSKQRSKSLMERLPIEEIQDIEEEILFEESTPSQQEAEEKRGVSEDITSAVEEETKDVKQEELPKGSSSINEEPSKD
jgi:preprotein translocase subunit SecG